MEEMKSAPQHIIAYALEANGYVFDYKEYVDHTNIILTDGRKIVIQHKTPDITPTLPPPVPHPVRPEFDYEPPSPAHPHKKGKQA